MLLEHDDDAGPDLSAVRAMLEWAAKEADRAVQILPIGVSRARWSKSAQDVLDLVEESSLRGNPFDLRGPQFLIFYACLGVAITAVAFWLRRDSARCQSQPTCDRNRKSAGMFMGTP